MYNLLIVLSVMGCFSMSAASSSSPTPVLAEMPQEVWQNILRHLDRDALDSLASSSNLLKRVVEEYKHNMMVKQIAYLKQPLSTKDINNGLIIQLPCLQPIDAAQKAKDDATSPWVFKSSDLKSLAIKVLQETSPDIFIAHGQYQDLITGDYVKHNLADVILEAMETEGLLTATEAEAVADKDLIRIALHHQYAAYNIYTHTAKSLTPQQQVLQSHIDEGTLSKLIACITESYSWVHNTDRVSTFKVIKESDIHHQLEAMTAFFAIHQETTLVVDIDRVDDNGRLADGSCLYGTWGIAAAIDNINCKSISITDSQQHLKTIGGYFMFRCKSLTYVDFSGLFSLQTIDDRFMWNCFRLTHADLSGLQNLVTIGNDFMSNCLRLTHADFSGLQNLVRVGNDFMSHCKSLTHADFSGLIRLKTIGNYFMFHCENLTHADFSGLVSLKSIGKFFIDVCVRLEEIVVNENNQALIQSHIPRNSNLQIIVK